MKIQHTPAPFPSTILSLEPQEFFRYRQTRIQAITISPLPEDRTAPYTLSGTTLTGRSARAYILPGLPSGASDLLRSVADQELARYAAPEQQQAAAYRALHPDARAVQAPAPAPAPGRHRA